MRVVLLPVGIVLVGYLGYYCSPGPIRGAIANRSSNIAIPGATPSPSDRLKMDQELQRQREAKLGLNSELAKLGLSSLKDSPPESGTEVRVCVGFGLVWPRCFILKRNGKHEASFTAAKISGGRGVVDENGKLVTIRTELPAPASGWDEFDLFLKDQGIEAPIRLSLDDKEPGDPDMEIVVLEVKSESAYSMVFFATTTESEDGKKALRVCARLEREFGVRMGCGAAAAT